MSDIANLQEAVETARAAYARASEQHSRSRKHAMSLIHVIEERVREMRIELSQSDVQRERMTREYGQLRQMLHALVMDVEVGDAGVPGHDATALETGPQVVTALAPVPVASEPREPAAEAAEAAKPTRRKRAKAGAAKASADSEALRAGLTRMLKKMRTPAAEPETVEAGETEAPAPAE
jgi:hypothetical protein